MAYKSVEDRKARDRNYYEANREVIKARATQYYLDNKEKVLVRSRERAKEMRMKLRQEAIEKLGGKCMDCDENNPIILQFHHRKGEIKVGEVTALATSPERFWPEVEKCDLVCANHHLIRHSEGR